MWLWRCQVLTSRICSAWFSLSSFREVVVMTPANIEGWFALVNYLKWFFATFKICCLMRFDWSGICFPLGCKTFLKLYFCFFLFNIDKFKENIELLSVIFFWESLIMSNETYILEEGVVFELSVICREVDWNHSKFIVVVVVASKFIHLGWWLC